MQALPFEDRTQDSPRKENWFERKLSAFAERNEETLNRLYDALEKNLGAIGALFEIFVPQRHANTWLINAARDGNVGEMEKALGTRRFFLFKRKYTPEIISEAWRHAFTAGHVDAAKILRTRTKTAKHAGPANFVSTDHYNMRRSWDTGKYLGSFLVNHAAEGRAGHVAEILAFASHVIPAGFIKDALCRAAANGDTKVGGLLLKEHIDPEAMSAALNYSAADNSRDDFSFMLLNSGKAFASNQQLADAFLWLCKEAPEELALSILESRPGLVCHAGTVVPWQPDGATIGDLAAEFAACRGQTGLLRRVLTLNRGLSDTSRKVALCFARQGREDAKTVRLLERASVRPASTGTQQFYYWRNLKAKCG